MLPKTLIFMVFLGLQMVSSVQAQEALSLKDAINLAVAQNPSLAAARQDAATSAVAVRGAKALANPELIVSPTVIGEAGSDSAVLLIQPLEINNSRKARTRIAVGESAAANADAAAVMSQLIRNVKIAYFNVVEAKSIVDLTVDNVKLVESLQAAAKRQVDVGASPGSQVIKAEVEVARARQDLRQAATALAQSKATLNTLIGRDPLTEFTASDGLKYESAAVRKDQSNQVPNGRPEVVREEALLDARRGEVSAAKSERRPDLTVQARMEEFDDSPGIALGITLPLFDWGSGKSKIRQAEAGVSAQQKRLDAQRNQVKLDVILAANAAQSAETIVTDYESGVLSKSEQLAQMAEKGYRTGATSYLEVLEAQRTLMSVRTEYITALADYAKAMAELEWAEYTAPQATEEVSK